ncbi:hypothetical protein TNCV_3569251 [Trichonephila clavipes]|nr:hypothetical protein TNCV_3569251 [Trichonephila clavipes]
MQMKGKEENRVRANQLRKTLGIMASHDPIPIPLGYHGHDYNFEQNPIDADYTKELAPPPSTLLTSVKHRLPCENCGGGDRWSHHLSSPLGEFRRDNSFCHLYGAQGQR